VNAMETLQTQVVPHPGGDYLAAHVFNDVPIDRDIDAQGEQRHNPSMRSTEL